MPGSDAYKGRKDKGKKKASTSTNDRVSVKAPRGPFAKSKKERQKKAEKKLEVPESDEEEDSDLEDALKGGEYSGDEDEEETVKVKSMKGKKRDVDNGADLRTGPVKELVFSDSEEDEDVGDDNEELPAGLHAFDLDEAPGSEDDDEEMDDEFDLGDEDDEEMEDDDEVDSAFASSNEGEEDVDMLDEEDEDEDGDIQTNLEDDLTNEGFTLPAVEGIEEELEHGVSLRDVETRMRWLVDVCSGKDERTSLGVPGQ
jgi:ribosomal RNA methyltransferase Nop2